MTQNSLLNRLNKLNSLLYTYQSEYKNLMYETQMLQNHALQLESYMNQLQLNVVNKSTLRELTNKKKQYNRISAQINTNNRKLQTLQMKIIKTQYELGQLQNMVYV